MVQLSAHWLASVAPKKLSRITTALKIRKASTILLWSGSLQAEVLRLFPSAASGRLPRRAPFFPQDPRKTTALQQQSASAPQASRSPEKHNQSRRLFNSHRRVIDQHRVLRSHQRRNFSFAVPLVSLPHFLQNFQQREALAFFLMLFPSPLRAHFRRSFQKSSTRARKYHRADVPPFHHHSAALPRALLLRHQHFAHARNRRQS